MLFLSAVVEEAINGCGYVVKEENHAEQQRKEMEIKEKEHVSFLIRLLWRFDSSGGTLDWTNSWK